MDRLNFRALRADEVELRVQQVFNGDNGVAQSAMFLLYKDARCDMNILDEVVGALNWKREHKRENANCVVSIWDNAKKEWVSKEDTGTESSQDKEKGLASDSFKRACFNWGIGRELYTAPDIKIAFEGNEGKYKKIWGLHVSEMEVKNGQITKLVVSDENKVRFSWPKTTAKPTPQPAPAPKPAVKEFIVPDNPTPEQLEVMNCKTKKELNTLFTTKGWAKNTELVNFAASYAQTLAA